MAIRPMDPMSALRQYGYNPMIQDPRLRTMLPNQFQAAQEGGWEYMGPGVGFDNPDAIRPIGGRWPTFGIVEGPGQPGAIPESRAVRGLSRYRV